MPAEARVEALIVAPGEVLVRRQEERPPRLRAGSVAVEVDHVTLCGSDFALFRGTYGGPRAYPIRFGHEWSGRIAAAPPGSAFRPGDRVTGDCSRWCGACAPCAGDRNLCRRIEKFGITTDGFSVRRRIVAERYLYRDRHGLPGEVLALTEIFAVARRGIARAERAAGLSAPCLVVGGGPLGVITALLLREHLSPVWVAERDAERRAFLRFTFPILRYRPPAEAEEAGSYRALHRAGRFPLVFDASGSASGFAAALGHAAAGGTVVAFGLGSAAVEPRLIVAKGLSVLGSIGGTGAFPEAMGFLARERELAARLLTHRVPASQAPAAFAHAGDPDRLKVQLDFTPES